MLKGSLTWCLALNSAVHAGRESKPFWIRDPLGLGVPSLCTKDGKLDFATIES